MTQFGRMLITYRKLDNDALYKAYFMLSQGYEFNYIAEKLEVKPTTLRSMLSQYKRDHPHGLTNDPNLDRGNDYEFVQSEIRRLKIDLDACSTANHDCNKCQHTADCALLWDKVSAWTSMGGNVTKVRPLIKKLREITELASGGSGSVYNQGVNR